MKNKLLILLSAIIFAVPFASEAIPLPMANVSVIVNTVGSDSIFHFDLQKSSGATWIDIQQFDLQTHNLTATGAPINVPAYIQLRITEQGTAGLKVNVSCVGDHNNTTFSYGNGVVDFSAVTTVENIVCTFNNVKAQNPVLIVPGLTGTEIMSGNDLLWANIAEMILSPGDRFMDPLSFDSNLMPNDSSVFITDVIRAKYAGAIKLFDYTESLINTFVNQEGYAENSTLFTFPYDWRYGVTGKLADGQTVPDKLGQKIQSIMQQTGSSKVDVIAHSMGGLIVKKYVMDHPSDNHIGKAVFVGVPNTGAPKAVKALVQGDNLGIPGASDAEIKKISENMPSAYDLLPSQQYYGQLGPFVQVIDFTKGKTDADAVTDLDYNQAKSYLLNDYDLNSQALVNAEQLHTASFDNFDMRTAGVDVYNIMGCKSGTLGEFTEIRDNNIFTGSPTYDLPKIINGDNTVPIESANNLPVDSNKKFYALVSGHAQMLTEDGIMQEIVNIISGSSLPVSPSLVTQDASLCPLNGKIIKTHSPVNLTITDQNGNKIGLADDGSTVNQIPNADFEIWGERKFVYLPTDGGQTYSISMQGTGSGTFTIINQDIQGGAGAGSEVFSNIPVTAELTGQMNVNNPATTLIIKPTADSGPITIQPSATINSDQSNDLFPPTIKATITGTITQSGTYLSNASINLKATDVVVAGKESQTSGILSISYKLDNQAYQKVLASSADVSFSTAGSHTITFFATDKAGNNSLGQSASFSVIKLPTSKDQCKKDGWKNYGSKFKNQGDCVSFVETGK